ncbi:cytochrome c oxidase subunit 8B, mitochondrial [Neoarius graeffei]|uniref:cytochrome c oxidase subunit 8B, mitochondrial n=1 Tax=Neoarius graeffei TaxID=443677 RepID=UPI00298C8656|nr:cytochrome c oxidase subunit 8B, mitochondrial [Neoarius graeffei]
MNSRVTGSESNSVELNTAAEAEALTLSPALRSAEGIMLALSRSSGLLRAALRHNFTPRANISAKPAKHVVSTGEHAIAMVAMFVTILVPSGWILTHLEDYKKRP